MAAPAEIRDERPEDRAAIRALNLAAFGQELEANIVEALRASRAVLLSLVAVRDGRIVGHALFSPIVVGGMHDCAALGPMAVSPERQRQGVGTALIEAGIARLRRMGYPCVVVVGHPEYYPRFGFKPASAYEVTSEWSEVLDEAFMLLVLDEAKMRDVRGLAKYRDEFSAAA